MSDTLKAFYVAYWEWVKAGAPDGNPFARFDGLCGNLARFLRLFRCNYELKRDVREELSRQFSKAGLDKTFPFGERSYFMRRDRDSQHLHKPRIDWVRKHAMGEDK